MRQFEELLDFVRQVRFHALGAFVFSAEPGTPAAKLPKQIPESVKSQRLEAIMQLQQQIVVKRNKSLIGKQINVLIERSAGSGNTVGRYYAQAPEVDSLCIFHSGQDLTEGRIVPAIVSNYDGYDLLVKPVD